MIELLSLNDKDYRRLVNVWFFYIFFCNTIQIKVHFVLCTNETSTEVPLSDQFCVSAGIAVRALHELIWEATDRKTTDHWPVHSLSSLYLCLPFPTYFISFSILFLSSFAFCGRCGHSLKTRLWMCQWPHPPAQHPPGALSHHAWSQSWPVTLPGRESPSEQCQEILL